MKSTALFASVLWALIVASECQPRSPPGRQKCPLWCHPGALPGSQCAPGCTCGQRQNRGPLRQLPCNPSPFADRSPSPPRRPPSRNVAAG
ncbi:hypothetical protein V5799_003716 [Amblyomma americanum]|uniref:Secreted protein n=1 Tax=Amblyomma americanum TaxID=6943 RepID=A0AAQ4D863_AMBAM